MSKAKVAVKVADQWLRQVLIALYRNRHLTRMAIGEITGLNAASASHALTYLLQRGLLLKTGEMRSETPHRRREVFDLNAEAGYFIGVDLEGDRIRFALTNFVGDLRYRWEEPLEFRQPLDPATVIEGIRRVTRDLDGNGRRRILAIGVSYPGMLDAEGRLVAVNLGWTGCGLAAALTGAFPEWPLFFESDKDTCLLAERSDGLKSARNALFLIAEGGIGLGMLVDGQLVRGMRGVPGEMGHWKVLPDAQDACNCGARGCLEAIASSPNIVRQYLELTGDTEPSRTVRITDVFERARQGHPAALAVLQRVASALGLALSHAISLLNPEVVILGGDLIAAEDVLVPLIIEEVRRRTLAVSLEGLSIRVSSLGLDIRLHGAVFVAFRSILERPELLKRLGTINQTEPLLPGTAVSVAH